MMAITRQEIEVATREQRLGSITGYQGTIGELVSRANGCSLQGRERCFSQASWCSSACAQYYLAGIVDTVIVNHAPGGCASDAISYNTQVQLTHQARGWKKTNVRSFSTNMTKEDTVFGATEKLQETIREAYRRYKPKAIFITTSCVSGIIGEDIQSALDDLKEEIPIPLAPVFCEGFKSKVWASGFDAAFHAILLNIVKPPRKKTNKVNLINFRGSARQEITDILTRLDLEPVFFVSQSTVEELAEMSEAVATIGICSTLSTYIGNALEQQYGVPYVKSLHPQGIAGFESWLRGLGEVTGKQAEVEAYIAEQREKALSKLAALKEKLRGHTAVVGMGPGFAHDYVRVLQELEVKVVWATAWHFDPQMDDGSCPLATQQLAGSTADLPVSVSDQQMFELINLLQRLQPDFYISRHPGTAVWAVKLGISSVMAGDEYTVFGYRGLLEFGYTLLDALTNRSRERVLAKKLKLPYTGWWLQQDTFSFLKEVK